MILIENPSPPKTLTLNDAALSATRRVPKRFRPGLIHVMIHRRILLRASARLGFAVGRVTGRLLRKAVIGPKALPNDRDEGRAPTRPLGAASARRASRRTPAKPKSSD